MALPNIGLEQSTVGVTTDPTWATRHEDNWSLIDAHDHTSGKGIPITPEALNINDDLDVAGNNIINLRSPIFQNLSTDPSEITDLNSLYFKNGNLWLNNGSGGHVQVSNGSGLNLSTGVSNLYSPVLVSTSTTILNTDTYTYIEVDTTTAINLFLPAASTVSGNRFYYIKDITGLSGTNAITLVPTGGNTIDASTSNYIMKRNFGSWLLVSDGVSKWFVSNFSNKEINDGTWNSVGSTMVIDAKANGFFLKNNVAPNAMQFNASNGTIAFFTTVQLSGNVTVGSSGTNTLNINSTVDIRNNSTIGSSSADTLTINSTSTINSPSTVNAVETHNADLFCNQDLTVGGNFLVSGTSALGTLFIDASGTISGDVIFSDLITCNSLVTCNDDLTVVGDFINNGNSTIGDSSSDLCTIKADADLRSNVTLGLNSTKDINLKGVLIQNGGRILENTAYFTDDAIKNIDVTLYRYITGGSGFTASHTYTISGSVQDNDWFSIQNVSSSFNINLVGLVTATISSNHGARYQLLSGTWRQIMSW